MGFGSSSRTGWDPGPAGVKTFAAASGEAVSKAKPTSDSFAQLEATQKSEGKILVPGNSKPSIWQDFMQKFLTEDRQLRRDEETCISVRNEFDHHSLDRDNLAVQFYFLPFIFNKSLYLYQKKIGINVQQYKLIKH